MSVADFLFQGSVPPNVTSSTTSESGYPAWYQELQKQIVLRGNQIAAEPYQTYTGQRTAGFTPDQTASFDMVRANAGAATPEQNQANQMYTSGGTFSQQGLDQFMSPYTDGVVNRIADLGARNLSEKLLPAVNDQFIAAGQYNSTRNQDFVNRALRDTQESVLGQQASALESAQNNAMTNYGNFQRTQLSAGEGLQGLATARQTAGLTDATAMGSIGETQQGQQQDNLNLAFQDFTNQKNYSTDQLNMLNSLLRGMQVPTSTSTTSTAPATSVGPSGLQSLTQLIGGLASLNGA